MKNIYKAKPVYNKKSNKWNIQVDINGTKLILGHSEGCIAVYEEYETKEEVIKYIHDDIRLELESNE